MKFQEVVLQINKKRFFSFKTNDNLCIFDSETLKLHVLSLSRCKNLLSEKLSINAIKFFSILENDVYKNINDERKFLHIKFAFSNLCNMNCSYCFVNKDFPIKTNIEKMIEILEIIYEKYHYDKKDICITYNILSEIFMEPKAFDEFLNKIEELNVKRFTNEDFSDFGEEIYLSVLPKEILALRIKDEKFVDFMNRITRFSDFINYIPNSQEKLESSDGWLRILYGKYRNKELDMRDLVLFNNTVLEYFCKNELGETVFSQSKINDYYFSYFFMTNGTLINLDVIKILKKHNINIISISLDGNKKINDINRTYRNKSSSYFDVINNIELLRKNGIKVIISSTIDDGNSDVYKLFKFFKTLDVEEINFSLMKNKDLKSSSLIKLKKSSIKLFDCVMKEYLSGNDLNFNLLKNSYLFDPLKRINSREKVMNCGFGKKLVINGNGDIYPCDYFVNNIKFYEGNIFSNTYREIRRSNIDERELCKDCIFRYLCGGQCAKNGNQYCDMTKSLIKETLYFYSKLINLGRKEIENNNK